MHSFELFVCALLSDENLDTLEVTGISLWLAEAIWNSAVHTVLAFSFQGLRFELVKNWFVFLVLVKLVNVLLDIFQACSYLFDPVSVEDGGLEQLDNIYLAAELFSLELEECGEIFGNHVFGLGEVLECVCCILGVHVALACAADGRCHDTFILLWVLFTKLDDFSKVFDSGLNVTDELGNFSSSQEGIDL